MNLLLELMQATYYRNVEGVVCADWRNPADWAHSMFGVRVSAVNSVRVRAWLAELSAFGAVEVDDRGEGIVLYRAVLA